MQQKNATNWNENQSKAIDLLRFPLTLAVLFIHTPIQTINLLEADFPLLSGRGIYNLLGITFSHVLPRIAVPSFFLFSGFLFFINFQKWTWNGYKKKLKTRIKTLFVPYIVWNLFAYSIPIALLIRQTLLKTHNWNNLIEYIKTTICPMFVDYKHCDTTRVNVLGWEQYLPCPIDLPLWFLRDLIVVSILSPVIYWFIKKTKIWGILFLFIAYVTRIWILTPGFSITAFFYFSLGAYFAINGKNIVKFAREYSVIIFALSCLLFVPCVVYDGPLTIIGNNIYPFYVVVTVFVALSFSSWIVERYKVHQNAFLVKGCFFVYAFHAFVVLCSPLGLARHILHTTIPGDTIYEDIACYLLTPFLTAAICILMYYLLTRYMPKIAPLFTGGR